MVIMFFTVIVDFMDIMAIMVIVVIITSIQYPNLRHISKVFRRYPHSPDEWLLDNYYSL